MTTFMFLTLFLGMTTCTSATYCVCNSGVTDTGLQRNIDYACGNGADCSPILQGGGCYQPNTVKAHCDYAVNNYYQRKSQVTGSCDFSGTATVTSTLPTTVASGCTYPASPSQVTSSTSPTTPSTTTGTPSTTSTTTGSTFGPSSSINPTGSSSPSYHASTMLLAVTTLVSGSLLFLR